MVYDIGAHDMVYWEFRQMCRKTWSQKSNHLCINLTKNKNEVKNRIFNESRNTYIECRCESEDFFFELFCLIENREDLEKLEELVSLQNPVNEVRLQDKFSKQIFHLVMKKLCKPLTDTIDDTS